MFDVANMLVHHDLLDPLQFTVHTLVRGNSTGLADGPDQAILSQEIFRELREERDNARLPGEGNLTKHSESR